MMAVSAIQQFTVFGSTYFDNCIFAPMQIESSHKVKEQSTQKPKRQKGNPKRQYQQALLAIDITPQKYRGMKFLGNFSHLNNLQHNESLQDPRLSCLDYAYFTNKQVLDVGSGQSLLTIQIAMRCFPAKIVALDIDGSLLERAKRRVDRIVAQNALYSSSEVVVKRVQQLPLYFQQQFDKNKSRKTLSMSSFVEIMTEGEEFKSKFPQNFCFYNQNFMNIQEKQKYDTLMLMKISKWMHLTFGDKGLVAFFEKAVQLLVPGGILILQYPLYRSYKKKKSLNRVYGQNVKDNIHIDPITFSSLLGHMGMFLIRQIETNIPKGLKHPIAVFRKGEKVNQQ